MRRRPFLRMISVGLGGLAVGCNGTIWSEPRTRDAGVGAGRDAGPVRVSLDAGPSQGVDAGARAPSLLDAGPGRPGFDAGPIVELDAGCAMTRIATLHDMHAQALYFDGTYGPTTGVIRVDDVLSGRPLEMVFWHGHGGVDHRFTVSASDLATLARGERVTTMTTEVDGHAHMLFVDPVGERWRVAGAADRTVEIC